MRNRDDGKSLSFQDEYSYNLSEYKRWMGTAFLYRYQYATSDFPNPTSISLNDICMESRRDIDYTKRVVDVKKVQERIKKHYESEVVTKRDVKEYHSIQHHITDEDILTECIGIDWGDTLEVEKDVELSDLKNRLKKYIMQHASELGSEKKRKLELHFKI